MGKTVYYWHINRLLKANGGHPEPNRSRLGYHSVNDPLALLSAVERNDKPFRSQTWRWLEEISGIPPTTIRRILQDSRDDPNSPLHKVARGHGYIFYTKAKPYFSNMQKRKIIVSVCEAMNDAE